MMEINRDGISRTVFLTSRYALKVPTLRYGFEKFLRGLLANIQETKFSRAGWEELCPVLFHLPLGILLVMPRVRVMTDEEFDRFDYTGFVFQDEYNVPAEAKADSFGWLNGKVVAIDYGN